MKFFNEAMLLADKVRPDWVVKSFPIIRIVLASLIAVLAVALIVLTLMQESSSNGASAITGEANTFYNRNKGNSLQGKIKMATIVCAASILVLCILYLVVYGIYHGV